MEGLLEGNSTNLIQFYLIFTEFHAHFTNIQNNDSLKEIKATFFQSPKVQETQGQ